MSSKSGSADLLEAMGVPWSCRRSRWQPASTRWASVSCSTKPAHHPAARFAAAPRRELGTRTLFNLLGPLTNPANAPHQLLGVFAERWVEPMANVLKSLGSTHVLVVHSDDGLDEVSLAAPTLVSELKDGQVTSYRIQPEDFGIQRQRLDGLEVDGPQASLAHGGTRALGKAGSSPGHADAERRCRPLRSGR